MSKREWKPGDVAMVTALNRTEPYRAFYDGKTWREYGSPMFCVDVPQTLRPLVVLDPDDREQVERLAKAWHVQPGILEWDECSDRDRQESVSSLSAALRSLVAQPRPTEPTGLGAVVEDEQGRKWVRSLNPGADLTRDDWRAGDAQFGDGGAREWFFWDDIKAVRVLSDGVA